MGEAKRRGSKDSRIAEALGLIKLPIEEIRKKHGLPESSIFMGYAVHHSPRDEFLAEINYSPDRTLKKWVRTPELAKCYDKFDDAYIDSQECNGSTVATMFYVGNQIYVFELN